MLDHILNIDSLELAAKQIDDFLSIEPSEDINELSIHGNELVTWLARSGKMLADIGYWRDEAIVNATESCDLNLPPSVLTKYINAKCKRENYVYKWIERINSTCVHRLDWLRTMVSKSKAEMQYQNLNP